MLKTRGRLAGVLRLAVAALALTSGLWPHVARAQAVSGTILGEVRDASHAFAPGATVVLVNTGTGLTRTVVADGRGEYTAPSLPTGTYRVSAELTGFKKVTVSNVRLGVDQKVRIDLDLSVGALAEVVDVQGGAPLVQTSSSDLSATVDATHIETLPLNGRNIVSLTRTIPGVTRGIPGANIDGAGGLAWRGSASFSANGQRPRDNNFLLDGVDNNENWLQSIVIFPSVDALDEFKLQTSTYSAEFGQSLGGVVSLQIKSGTNQYRGGAFGFLRNDALDANNFFSNKAGKARPELSQYQFGGTLGGPIRKDRTFFFADYQGLRSTQGVNKVSTVPSDLMRKGDFSELNRSIYDPRTGLPFPGSVIPRDLWDPAAANVLAQLIPLPNSPGRKSPSGQIVENYVINPIQEREDDQFDVKIDHALSDANRFFVRYSFEKSRRFLPASLPQGDGFANVDSVIKAHSVAVNDTHTFGPRWLNELRLGYSYFGLTSVPRGSGQNIASDLGIPNVNLGDELTSGMSVITFPQQGMQTLGTGQRLITNLGNLQVFDSVTHIRGRHTLKAGASVIFRSREILNNANPLGAFTFNQNQTSNCARQPSCPGLDQSSGFDVASFLLGYTITKTRGLIGEETYTEKRPEWAAYVQDDFRATSRLTLNLGLRWDVFVPFVEKDDRQSNFDPSTGRFVVASEDAVIAGVNVGRYLQTYSKKDLGPRLGFAYDVFGKGRTLVRGGFGVFWNWGPGGTSSSKAQNPPFLRSATLNTTFGTNLTLSGGAPSLPEVDPSRPPEGSTRSAFDTNARDAYALNWNLNVQQQLGRDSLVEVAYVGSKGGQLVLKTDQNQAPPTLGVNNPNLNRPYIRVSPLLRTVGTVETSGTLDYHALLVKLQRRFSNGFSFLTSYTYGKAIDLASDNDGGVTLTDIFHPAYNRGPADYDVTHTLSSSWIYALPFGRERRLGGWQVNGIVYWRTGLPVTITQAQGMSSTGVPNRPDRIGDGRAAEPTVEQWFDPTAFRTTKDLTATFGTAGRNILRGPQAFNIDLSLIKTTRIGRVESELRIEAFNLFNHPQFALPNSQFGTSSFGAITMMAGNPACISCGTTERQIQLGIKLRF